MANIGNCKSVDCFSAFKEKFLLITDFIKRVYFLSLSSSYSLLLRFFCLVDTLSISYEIVVDLRN